MAKYYGAVGYVLTMKDDGFGVYDPKIVERPYYGDLIESREKNQTGEGVNDDITIQNDISIVADTYAYQNFHQIRYVTFMGVRWTVNSVTIKRPRLILSVGGVYNGQTPETASEIGANARD